ncbi:MAG: A/G-specific adenine glycosylase [Zoogloeaceae bacterium]|jgi:A/G-specific adenine glycosylase|nr:A/G-specific adenine glycosylase [Zoogloeaceae bacterium]
MSDFSRRVVHWQRQHGRHDLPWQQTRDPYPVWLSEIMLQQTQVSAVLPYFQRFLARFPCLETLAAATREEVLALWSGLGYYARARNLHAAARLVVAEYGGRFPGTAAALAKLPGVGRSTAAAIAAFAFGERAAILDGNVKRVLCRHFAVEGIPVGAVEKALWTRAESLLPAASADMAAYTQGLMDLGATLCLRHVPDCAACPLAATCRARREGRTASLPTPRVSATKPERHAVFWLVTDGERLLLQQRPSRGIWGGLLSLPEDEDWRGGAIFFTRAMTALPQRVHVFTHFRLTISPRLVRLVRLPEIPAGYLALTFAQARAAALPAPVARLLAEAEILLNPDFALAAQV